MIIKDINGIFKNGQLNVIMGSSGSGKTTLVNIIAQRINKSQLKGELYMNNEEYDLARFSQVSGYVMQQDQMFEYMTPYEVLKFCADLKYKEEQNNMNSEQFIDSIIEDFKLSKCKDTLIGGAELKGISGGERKRTSIALELIKRPDILVLDEPTSGLDSCTSLIICELLKRYACQQQKTVIMTIHQPNEEIFDLFDRLTLLLQGQIVYQGGAGQVRIYLENMGFKIPLYSTISDYFMQILHPEHDKPNLHTRFQLFITTYANLQSPTISQQIQLSNSTSIVVPNSTNTFLKEFKTIFNRTKINNIRNPLLFKGRLFSTIILGLIAGSVWFQLPHDPFNQRSIHDKCAALFFLCMNQFQQSFNPVILTFPAERGIFLREQNSGLYGVFSYFLARTIPEIFNALFFPMLLCPITYYMVGLNQDSFSNFIINLIICILISLTGNSLALFLGCLTSDQKIASAISPIIFLPLLQCSGFYANSDSLPVYLKWINYIDPFAYAFNGILHNEFDNQNNLFDPIALFNPKTLIQASIIYLLIIFVIFRLLALIALRLSINKLQV